MDGYYIEDRLTELWRKINSLHLSYLQMENNPKKLELKNKLDDCIKDYLCVAPHSQKFCFKETAEVLHRSASSKKDFSGYRAVLGWNAIGMYAGNLISQPWRQEYRKIKMYSGFYMHQIDANLVGAEIMFEAMGYKQAGNGIMVLEGPICPDRVTNVSQDSLVANVECQILKEIWEEVSATFKISWLEVLEFRESHLCSPKKSVEALRYQIQQRQYHDHQRSHSQGNGDYSPSHSRYPPTHMHITSPNLSNHSFPPLSGHSHLPLPVAPMLPPPPPPAPNCIYTNGYYPNNFGTCGAMPLHYNYVPSPAYAPVVLKQPYNDYYCNNYVPSVVPYNVCAVPTAQLIEVDHHGQAYDVPDGGVANKIRRASIPSNEVKNRNPPGKEEYDSWDYVYKDLENQGYTKDLGERGDLLVASAQREEKILKDLDNLKVNDGGGPLKINEALEKYNKQLDKKQRSEYTQDNKNLNGTPSSSYDNLSANEVTAKTKPPKGIIVTKNKTAEPESEPPPKATFLSKTLDLKKIKMGGGGGSKGAKAAAEKSKTIEKAKDVEQSRKVSNDTSNKWQCNACTYLNDPSKGICEVCSKSKVVVSHEMEIGGSECSKCTLVNPKDKKICDACGASLQNSPTYI